MYINQIISNFSYPERGQLLTVDQAMDLAINIGYLGLVGARPNPMVGAVVLDENNRFLAADYHRLNGHEHAEKLVLEQISRSYPDKGNLKLFVNLEPCSHIGRQPPCVQSIIQSNVKEVFYALVDPNPKVFGKGIATLKSAGINCLYMQSHHKKAYDQNKVFLHTIVNQTTFVSLKAAVDYNGVMALDGDRRRRLTSQGAIEVAHYLRAYYDAIIVGAKTVILDDSQLTNRYFKAFKRSPTRVVICGQESIKHLNLKMKFFAEDSIPVMVFYPQNLKVDHLVSDRVTLVGVDSEKNGICSTKSICEYLWASGLQSAMLEGGSGLISSFLNEQMVSYVHLFVTPNVIMGSNLLFWNSTEEHLKFVDCHSTVLGPDLLIESHLEFVNKS